MNRIIIGTGVTENYLPKAENYFQSLKVCNSLEAFCVTLGFVANGEMQSRHSHIRFVHLPMNEVQALVSNRCLQHGDFIEALLDNLKIDETDIIIYTDADITIQRDLSSYEKERILAYDSKTVGLGLNSNEEDTLEKEFARLQPKISLEEILKTCGSLELPIYNTGVIIAKLSVWRMLRKEFVLEWANFEKVFGHYAGQQWLLSWLVRKLNVDNLKHDIHVHGHFGLPSNINVQHGVTYYKKKPTFLRHHLENLRKEFFFFGHYLYDSPTSVSNQKQRWVKRFPWILKVTPLIRALRNRT